MGFFKKLFGGDWQDDVKRQQEERISRERAAEEIEDRKRSKEREKDVKVKLRDLSENFKCHECGIKAKEPHIFVHEYRQGSESSERGDPPNTYEERNYDLPGDLFICPYCDEWTCYSRSCSMNIERLSFEGQINLHAFEHNEKVGKGYSFQQICKHCAKEHIQ